MPSANEETLIQENLLKLGENSESKELQPPSTRPARQLPLFRVGMAKKMGFLPHPSQGVQNLTEVKGQATIVSQLQVQEARFLVTVAPGLGVVFLCPVPTPWQAENTRVDCLPSQLTHRTGCHLGERQLSQGCKQLPKGTALI